MKTFAELNLLKNKIPDTALCQFAADQSNKPDNVATVIIELDLPHRQVRFEDHHNRRIGFSFPRILTETPDQQAINSHKIDAANELLTKILGEKPHWLRAARAFVARATPEQIRSIARSSLVKWIQPNRRLDM